MEGRFNVRKHPVHRPNGFSLLELMVVVAIMMIVAAVCVMTVNTAVQTSRIRGTANRYAELLQTARGRAAADDRFYSVYIAPAAGVNPQIAYVDIEPKALNGVSGNGAPPGGARDPRDPMTTISPGINPQPATAAPATANLRGLFCGNCTAGMVLNTAPTWGPDGMPCKSQGSLDGSSTVCNSGGGLWAYVTYFQSQVNQQWSAVTISPAGRVKAWYYSPNTGIWAPQ
jgi:prepilin-type N-terminal cleavage/methylation domain-containing protein